MNDDCLNKIGLSLRTTLSGHKNEEALVNIFVQIISSCGYETVANELGLAGLRVDSGGSTVITGSIAIRNLKALVELPYVIRIEEAQRLHTC